MFCTKCGAQIADGSKFCTGCGAPLNSIPERVVPDPAPIAPTVSFAPAEPFAPAFPVTPEAPAPVIKKKPILPIIIIAAAVTVVIAVVLVLSLSGGGYKDYNDLIGAYFDASADNDADAVLELLHPNITQALRDTDDYFSDYEILEDLDDWYSEGYYGYPVESWYVTDIDYMDDDDTSWMGDILGVYVESWIVVRTNTDFAYGESYYYDFDLVCVDGYWYIIDVY